MVGQMVCCLSWFGMVSGLFEGPQAEIVASFFFGKKMMKS